MRTPFTWVLAFLAAASSACALVGFDLDGYGPAGKSGVGGDGLHASSSASGGGGSGAAGAGGETGSSGGGGTGPGGSNSGGTGGACPACCGNGVPAPGVVCFGSFVQATVGLNPQDVAIADLDRDNQLDIVIALPTANAVSVLRNAGNGAFAGFLAFESGTAPRQLAVGLVGITDDFIDIVTGDASGFSVLENMSVPGNVMFKDYVSAIVPGAAHLVALVNANTDADSYPDIALVEVDKGTVHFLINDGASSFMEMSPPSVLAGISDFSAVAVADLNVDGRDDVIVVDRQAGSVTVLRQTSDLTFTLATTPLAPGSRPRAIAVVDLDLDDQPDLVTANEDGTIAVLMNDGGTPTLLPQVAFGVSLASLAAGDFDNDGVFDLAVTDPVQGQVILLLGNGDGTFAMGPVLEGFQSPGAIATADLDNDGALDLVVAEPPQDRVTIVRSNP